MAIEVEERILSRRIAVGDRATARLTFTIKGTADDYAAWVALGDEADSEWHGLVRTGHDVNPEFIDKDDASRCIWEGTVHYGRFRREPDTNVSRFSFDTRGGTKHITSSIDTVRTYPSNAPNYKGAIGWDGQTVQGTDITVPVYQFTETHYLPDVYVDEVYIRDLCVLTGQVNDGVFRRFSVGEVLFLGAEGKQRSLDDWEIVFSFAASPNRVGIDIGQGTFTGVRKRGWEYLWIKYTPTESGSDLIPTPEAVYVEQVYDYGDFYIMGIGT